MFAEVFKKDSLQDDEYAECYVFDKRMLLPKADSEPYSSDYDETIIKNFHQKQSSYAQSEGYHSYVSSNDSAIIAPFSDSSPSTADDRPQADGDFMVSTDENSISMRKHSNSIADFVSWPTETSKCYNSYSNSGNSMKNVNYDKYNPPHIAHSARVQTPQKHHSETVLFLDTAKAPQQQFHKDINQNHGYANSQLRKLYPVHTYSVQPRTSVASNVTSGVSEFNGAKQLQLLQPPLPSKSQVSKHSFEIDNQQFDDNEHCGEYTFLDPSKKRIISNQNLKVIQKQALISYYERHHSTWRSEPQLSFNSSSVQSQSRPRLPTPTSSCHLTSPSADEELSCTNSQRTTSTTCNIEPIKKDDEYKADYSCHTSPLEPIMTDLAISTEDRVPELPPKKVGFRATPITHRAPSPDLPPPPPPLSNEESYISDEPFPPPPSPCEAAFISDSPKITSSAVVSKIDIVDCDTSTNTTLSSLSNRSTAGTRTRICCASGINELSSCSSLDVDHSVARCDATAYNKNIRISSNGNLFPIADHIGKTMGNVQKCNSSRFSSSSFRAYTRTANEFNAKADKHIKRQSSSSSATLFSEKQQFSFKLQRTKDIQATSQTARHSETQQIEPKVKTIRTLFEDKFRKSINSKHFQFPSFSFMHTDKFPSRLDPRFPRTSYQITHCSDYREIRDSEEGIVSNTTGIYKRTTSPPRQAQNPEKVLPFPRMINDAKYDNACESIATFSASKTADITTFTSSSDYTTKSNDDLAASEKTSPSDNFAAPLFEDRVAKISAVERFVENQETVLPTQHSPPSSPFSANRTRSVSSSSLNSTNIPESQYIPINAGFSEDDAIKFSSEVHSTCTTASYDVPASIEYLNRKDDLLADTARNDDKFSFVTNLACQKKGGSPDRDISNLSSHANCSKNCTIDAASQTDINVISKELIPLGMPVSVTSSRIDEEVEKLRREVISCVGPGNRLYKILAPNTDIKKSTDYLENIFQESALLRVPAFLKKNFTSVNESDDTRLQEGSISYHETEFEILQQSTRSEICDKTQNLSPPMVRLLKQKKKNLVKHLIHKLDTLKAEQRAISDKCHQNDELGTAISEKIFRCLNVREASKCKLHIQEVGLITNLLLGLGARLAKIENSLSNLPENCQNQKKVLEDKKQQLVLQLEDAKELKKNIDKRSISLMSSLQKYFNEQELNEYQQFIQTKCKLLIYNKNLSDEIFQTEQQVNDLKEDDKE